MKIRYCQKQLAAAVAFVNKNNPVLQNQITLTEAEDAIVDSVFDATKGFYNGMVFLGEPLGEDFFVNIYTVPVFVEKEKDISIVEVDVSDRVDEYFEEVVKNFNSLVRSLDVTSPDPEDISLDERITHKGSDTLQ